MDALLVEIRQCRICQQYLPHGVRPIVQAGTKSRILIIGQAPGVRVHTSGIPWDDASGNTLRQWLGFNKDQFYDPEILALMPMGFCFPGSGTSGDLPPRPECAPTWHDRLLAQMPDIQLTLLIGQYAQNRYLGEQMQGSLTEKVRSWRSFLPNFLPLPHPSPRNRFWIKTNPWFEEEVLPFLKTEIRRIVVAAK